MALNIKNRLKKKKEFDDVFQNGKTVNGSFLFIKFKKNNLEVPRFGFIAGLKISKKAVERNRIKRLLSEVVRVELKHIKNNYDIITVVKSAAIIKADKNDVIDDFNIILKKLK